MSDSVQPHRWQPTRLTRPWDSPGKNTGVRCHFLLQCMKVKSESEVAQSCLTLRDPMDCSLPGSSIHGIFQARVLEWGAIAFSDSQMAAGAKCDHRTCVCDLYQLGWAAPLGGVVRGGDRRCVVSGVDPSVPRSGHGGSWWGQGF